MSILIQIHEAAVLNNRWVAWHIVGGELFGRVHAFFLTTYGVSITPIVAAIVFFLEVVQFLVRLSKGTRKHRWAGFKDFGSENIPAPGELSWWARYFWDTVGDVLGFVLTFTL